MLEIVIPSSEFYNENTSEFITIDGRTLRLEHSLVSISKWESKWKKPFLSDEKKTTKETVDYIKCMTITQNVPDTVYFGLTTKNLKDIEAYIDDPMTATWFSEDSGRSSFRKNVITSEIIYYWMIANQIPIECQKWNLNRLLTLIRVCSVKSHPEKKMSRSEVANRNRELNLARKKQYNTKG